MIYFRAKEGWHVALDFNDELGNANDTVNGLKLHIVDETETNRGRRDRNSFELFLNAHALCIFQNCQNYNNFVV